MKLLLAVIMTIVLASCAQHIQPPSENYAYFHIGDQWMKIRTEPYENAMPGSSSENYIIPIRFELQNNEERREWPRKLRITKVDIPGVPKSHIQLDHEEWMHNALEMRDGNTIRVAKEQIAHRVFHMWVHFKDHKGKRYKVYFHNLGIGIVH